MSDYWVSKKKYFCKYCDIFIADDAPSRQQHENGLRHKGNKDRFIRDLYKAGEKKKKDKQDEDREMKMIDQAAHAAYAKDVGLAAAASAIPSSSASKPAEKPFKPTDKWANYSDAASLGIVDTDAELRAAQAAIRQKEGRIGEWSTVAIVSPSPSGEIGDAASGPSISKRLREPSPDDEEDTRKFKVRQKTASVGLGNDLYDPGEIKVKKREGKEPETMKREDLEGTAVPEWRPAQWRRAGENQHYSEDGEEGSVETNVPPLEPPATAGNSTDRTAAQRPDTTLIKPEEEDMKPAVPLPDDSQASSGSLFKKRKAKPATAGARRGL